MEDIKQIQEFFSKPLEEGKQLDNTDFTKVVKAVEQTGHPVTVLLVPKFNEIEVLTGMDAPDDMIRDLSIAVDSLGYGRNDIIIAADSSNLSRREYSDIFRVNGGHKDYFEEGVNEMDINDPILMKMRAAKDKLAKMRAANAGDDGNDKFFDNAKKIAFLKKEREQLMRDMEQEAEPEGGPIADEYGSKLNRIDKAIAKLSGRKEMTYDQAINEYDVYMPSQEEVDKFFALTQNETHYLNSKPVMGQEGTFNLMPIEPWDEYDLSNWNALVRKAKQRGKSIDENDKASTIKDKIEKLRKLSNSGEIDGDEFLDKFNPLQKQLKSIDEDNSYARVSKPRFKKDKNNPNFLNVYLDYDIGPGGATVAFGKETMSGQIRRLSSAKARKIAHDIALDLEANFNLEDIEVTDLENGKVRIFAVSDDFIDMDSNMLGKSVNEELNLPNYGKVTPPKGGASLAGQYNSIQGKSKYDTVIFDYQEGSDKPYGIVQVEGHGIYGSDLLKRLGLRQTKSWTAGVDVYIHDGNNNPVYVSEDDFKALLDFWSGGLDREAKSQADFYRGRGNTSGTIDEALNPEVSNALDRFIKAMAKRYDYSEQDAVYAIMAALKQRDFDGVNEATEDEEDEFHKDLDKLVHKTFGHSSDEKKKSMAQELAETIKLGEGVIEEELCPKGKAYIKRRKAAGEKSSAYLSGRAVKVCKGQMSGRKKTNENIITENIEDEMFAAMKNVATALEKANDNVKPSPKDEKVEEGIITLGATIVGAPGLMTALGKGANYLGKAFGKDKNAIGEFLKKKGHQLEEFYIESLGGWIKAAFPNKYEGQEITDESSDLYKAAQKAYAAMLTVAAVGAGYEAGAAANVVKAGVEGGMAVLKSSEVVDIIRKLA